MPDPNVPNPKHNPDTFSTSIIQKFDDGAGLPFDSPEALNRQRRGRPANAQPHEADTDETPRPAE